MDLRNDHPVGPIPEGDQLTARERAAVIVEERFDIPMAVLAVLWAVLVAYELIAPARWRDELTVAGNIIWAVFVLEFVAKLWISGHPLRFLRHRWPSLLFLLLPALRLFRVVRALRVFRMLPAARVVGSSYRAIGTARSLLQGRLAFLGVTSAVVIFSGGQLLYLVEADRGEDSLGDALWWAANLALNGNTVFEPTTVVGRLLAVALAVYALAVFASLAGSVGAFFIESRAERAAVEDTPAE